MKKNLFMLLFTVAFFSTRAQVIEDFEPFKMNIMRGDLTDLSYLSTMANPGPSILNSSPNVGMLYRDKDGVPWGGFFAPLTTPLDFTDNKYIHVKVWKPRLSPVRFKIELGAADPLEIESMNPQT